MCECVCVCFSVGKDVYFGVNVCLMVEHIFIKAYYFSYCI